MNCSYTVKILQLQRNEYRRGLAPENWENLTASLIILKNPFFEVKRQKIEEI
jgi:hypothetical protein